MSIRYPSNPVFPVVLISSIVFSILSLPFFLYHSQTDAASSIYQGFQPVAESKNRDLTIRYIGAAMVLSVVAGISTIEVQRKRQARQTTIAKLLEFDQEAMETFDDAAPLYSTEFEVEPIETQQELAS